MSPQICPSRVRSALECTRGTKPAWLAKWATEANRSTLPISSVITTLRSGATYGNVFSRSASAEVCIIISSRFSMSSIWTSIKSLAAKFQLDALPGNFRYFFQVHTNPSSALRSERIWYSELDVVAGQYSSSSACAAAQETSAAEITRVDPAAPLVKSKPRAMSHCAGGCSARVHPPCRLSSRSYPSASRLPVDEPSMDGARHFASRPRSSNSGHWLPRRFANRKTILPRTADTVLGRDLLADCL